MPNWVLNSKFKEVLNIIDKFVDIQIYHIFWEGNKKADQLANEGADGKTYLIIRDR